MGSGAWALGLFVSQFLGPRAHPLVWYFFSLVLVVSLVVISLVVISFVVSCLRTVATSTCNTSREISPKQRACTCARRARRERSGKHAARVHATASRATPCRQAANTRLSKQHRANVHVYMYMLCVCNMSITSETCRRSACVSSVLYRSVHVCEALCSERAWQWRPKAGATRCAHCFSALYATFFLHGAERAVCI